MRTLSWWVGLVWVLSFALLVLNAGLALYNVNALRRTDALVTQAQATRTEVARLLADMSDVETSSRGFVLSGRDEFLEPYREAERQLDGRLSRLRELVAGDAELEAGLATVETLVHEKFAVSQAMIDTRRGPGGEARGRDMVARGLGKSPMDRLRVAINHVDDLAAARLAERIRTEETGYRSTEFATVLGGGLTVAMAAMAFALARRELSARKRAEEGLLRTANTLADAQRKTVETLALLDTFVGHAPIGMAFFDPELRYVRVNEHLAKSNGKPAEEHLGRRLPEVVPDIPPRVLADLRDVLVNGQAVLQREVSGRGPTGDRTWTSSYYPVQTHDGRTLGVGVVTQDVTERLAAERRLRESESRYRTLAEAIPQMIWNSDAVGRVSYFNRRWVEYTGLTAAKAVETWWTQVAHPDDAVRMEAAWRRAVADHPAPFEEEVRIRDVRDGSYRWFQTAVVPLHRSDGTVDQWIGSLSSIDEQKNQSELFSSLVKMRTAELESANQLLREEITERTRAEARAQASAVELGRSNEELEKFAYVASHDLQEPLRKIQAFGDRLVKKHRDLLGPDGQEYIDRMKDSASRMRKLIDDLLAFSRVTSKAQPFTAVDLNPLVADMLSVLEARIAETGGRVDVGELPTIEADPFQMRQLFQNLLANALKFHKPGVAPMVTVRAVSWAELFRSGELPPSGNGYRITIADNGIGFDPAYAERVFEMFQRLHGRGEYEGTGIGLAICRKIVQRHRGTIAAHSRDGDGATFVIDLPSTPAAIP
jgi:PAS domain S-box-containing protein